MKKVCLALVLLGVVCPVVVAQTPIARLGQPQDMTGTCLFLLSDAASWVSGQIVAVDGGHTVRP